MLTAKILSEDEHSIYNQYMTNHPNTIFEPGMGVLPFVSQNIEAMNGLKLKIVNGNYKDVCPTCIRTKDSDVLSVYVSDISTAHGKLQLLYWYFEKFQPDIAFSPTIFSIENNRIIQNNDPPAQIEKMDENSATMYKAKVFLKLLEYEPE